MLTETWVHKTVDLEVDAVQLTEENAEEVAKWCGGFLIQETDALEHSKKQPGINVPTYEGRSRASLGAYITKDLGGNFTVRSPASFTSLWKRKPYFPSSTPNQI